MDDYKLFEALNDYNIDIAINLIDNNILLNRDDYLYFLRMCSSPNVLRDNFIHDTFGDYEISDTLLFKTLICHEKFKDYAEEFDFEIFHRSIKYSCYDIIRVLVDDYNIKKEKVQYLLNNYPEYNRFFNKRELNENIEVKQQKVFKI